MKHNFKGKLFVVEEKVKVFILTVETIDKRQTEYKIRKDFLLLYNI